MFVIPNILMEFLRRTDNNRDDMSTVQQLLLNETISRCACGTDNQYSHFSLKYKEGQTDYC